MSLPFLGDDIFVLIAAELDACMLGRLGCTAQRFWRASVPDPAHKGSALPCLCVLQGLLLDLDAAIVTVWVNGVRKGVMVRPGMTDVDGEPVGRLEGPLRWAVALGPNASVEIAGALSPPA